MQKKLLTSVRSATLGLLGLAGALAAIFRFLGRQDDLKTHVPEFIALSLAAGAVYFFGVHLVERFALGPAALAIILGGGVVFRLLLLPARPSLSDDVYRYQWEGRVQRAHFNPYTVFPAMPGLAWLQDPKHPLEAGRTTSAIYPPLTEMVFSLLETVPGYKLLFVGLDLATLGVLLMLLAARNQPLAHVLAYAWNPTVIVSFAMCGHNDSLAILMLLGANLFIIGYRPALSIAFLALSFLSKYFPAILLPVFLKRTRWAYAAIFVALSALAYLPYAGAGRELIRGLSDYLVGWEGNAGLFRLIRLAGNTKPQAELVAGVIVLGLLAYAFRKRLEPLAASFLLTAGLLLISPNAFPWYFTWSIPFLCFYPSPPWLLMSVMSVLGYSPVIAYAAGQPYRDSPFVLTLEYVPVYVWLAYEGWRAVKRDSGPPLSSAQQFSPRPV